MTAHSNDYLTDCGGGMTPMKTEESTVPLEQSVMASSSAAAAATTTMEQLETEEEEAMMPPLPPEGDHGADGEEMDEETSKVIDMAVDAVDKANLPTLPQPQQHNNGGEDYYNDNKKVKKDRKEFTAEGEIVLIYPNYMFVI